MKSKTNPFLRSLALAAPIVLSLGSTAFAAQYQWGGATSTDWVTAGNWTTGTNITAGPAPTGGTFAHRLNVLNVLNNKLVYTAGLGTTTYANTVITTAGGGGRGLVIGSGTNVKGELEITGGTFSTLGALGQDIIGNGDGSTGTLTVSGGTFIGTTLGTSMNLGGAVGTGRVSNLTVSGTGTATLASLLLNGVTLNVNLNGGTLELNGFTNSSIATSAKIRLNGGNLKARQTNASFIVANPNLETLVQSGGAVIDTNTFDISIAEPLLEDATSPGGGITKNSAGLLTLGEPSTTTGAADVNAGGLSVKAGAASWAPSSFSHSGDILNFNLGSYSPSNPVVINTGALTVDSAVTVNVTGSNFLVGQIPLINYTTKSITGSLTLNPATLPAGVVATLVDNGTNQIYLNVTQAASVFTWSGATGTPGTGDWDTSSLTWNTFTTAYSTSNSQLANFPDIATGGTVNITAAFSPLIATINNASGNPYTFSGTGKITGATVVNKSNTGIAYFANSNDYTGATTISAGALVKKAADATTGSITVTADNVSFVLDGGVTDGAGQTLNLAGRGATAANYYFTGSNVQRGALQAHNGASTWQGDIVLTSNQVSPNFSRIGVQNGASLTITGTISENIAGAGLLLRAGLFGDDITLGGAGTYSYTGGTEIFSNGASIILGASDKLPTDRVANLQSGGTTVFDLNGFNQTVSGLGGSAVGSAATILNNHATNPSVVTVAPALAAAPYYQGLIADGASAVSFVKNGDGKQTLAGNNTYTGITTINAGQLEINADQSATGDITIAGGSVKLSSTRTLSSGVNLSIASGGFFYPDGSSQTLGKLEGAGKVDSTYTVAGVDTLTVGANDATSTFSGVIQQSTVRTHALTKIGTGTLTLTGLNTYTGDTLVDDGTLSVALSNFANASTVTIGATAGSAAVLNLPNAGTDIVAALVIDGVSQPGNGVVYDSTNSGGAITGTGKIQVGVGGYGAWAIAKNVTQGENGDDDNDGLSNLVEYALGLNPQASSVPVGTFTGNLLTFVKGPEAKAAGDVTYQIETSTSLGAGSWTTAAATNTTDDISYLLPSNQPGGKIFARLKVVKP